MNRRDAIQMLSVLLGGALTTPLIAGARDERIYFGPSETVTAEQERLLAEVADVIIPDTRTPGAKAAGVEKFIVRVMRDCYPQDEQIQFYEDLKRLGQTARTDFGKDFADLSAGKKTQVLQKTASENKPFFLLMKSLTVTGYFTSEIGATQALDYLPVPGRFEGSYPLTHEQKSWAL